MKSKKKSKLMRLQQTVNSLEGGRDKLAVPSSEKKLKVKRINLQKRSLNEGWKTKWNQ